MTPKTANQNDRALLSDVVVLIDRSLRSAMVLKHAQRIAGAFGGNTTLLHILWPSQDDNGPVDPVDWDIKKQQARNWLSDIVAELGGPDSNIKIVLLEGQVMNQISAYMANHQNAITAAVRPDDHDQIPENGSLVGAVLSASRALLVVPNAAPPASPAYSRILVPLDGSSRAETALPVAATLAMAEGAEVVLCYVPPRPGLTEFGIPDQESTQLSARVQKRNVQAGQSYLTKIKDSQAHLGFGILTLVVDASDVRRGVIETANAQSADIIVMATHGESGHADIPAGSVAKHVLGQSNIPVLMVRCEMRPSNGHATNDMSPKGLRHPIGNDQ